MDTNDNSQDFEIKNPTPINSKGETVSPPSFSEAPWPMSQHDSRHTGNSPFTGPGSSDNPKISAFLEGEGEGDYFGSPAVGSDGTIYLGAKITKDGITREGIFAFAYAGTEKWFSGPFSSMQIPTLSETDGTIYVASYEGFLAIDITNGAVKWRKCTGLYTWQTPVIGNSGIIYLISGCSLPGGYNGSCLMSFQNNGTINWIYAIEKGEFCFDCVLPDVCETGGGSAFASTPSNPTIDSNGIIYFSYNDTLFAFNPEGTEKWHRTFENDCDKSTYGERCNYKPRISLPVFGSDGTIYVIAYGEQYNSHEGTAMLCFHTFDSENPLLEKWNEKCSSLSIGDMSISSLGNIYAPAAYNPDGGLRIYLLGFDSQGNDLPGWLISVASGDWGGPLIIDKDEIIYGVFGRTIKAFNQLGQEKFSIIAGYLYDDNLSLGGDGKLYISGSKKLYVIEP